MVKYISSNYIPKVLDDKINLYRSLKLLKLVATEDKTIVCGREKTLALAIYNCPACVLLMQAIL